MFIIKPRSKKQGVFSKYLSFCYCIRVIDRTGLSIGQTRQVPGVSRLDIKTLPYWFFIFLGCSARVKIVEVFDYCVSHIGQGN